MNLDLTTASPTITPVEGGPFAFRFMESSRRIAHTAGMRVLIVEDEAKTARAVARVLREEGHAVDEAADGEDGLHLAASNAYDVIVLDVRLPKKDGLEVCRRLRADGGTTPVLMLTANTLTPQKVEGLDAGADDYLTKPFEIDELLARLRALVRRGAGPRPAVLRVADLVVDPAARTAKRGGRAIDLTSKEFAILEMLARRPGKVSSRTEILEGCWDMNFESDSNVIDVHIASLRKKLESGGRPRLLQTARGAGYALRKDA